MCKYFNYYLLYFDNDAVLLLAGESAIHYALQTNVQLAARAIKKPNFQNYILKKSECTLPDK
jgi:hypothetical protein